ncbi:MAG TPA: hypothetical protein HA315_04490 [Candidatus Thalassarchaeaceae archaeon]|nr:hypothetical protein [Candidatus Thalassarchaeaceae archaeon]
MARVLVDTCGWVALVKSGLNLDSAMSSVIGRADLIVIDSVWKELDDLSRSKRGLLLELLKTRSEMIDDPPEERHTDMMLIRLSKMNSWPVLTVDTRLKEKLSDSGCAYIEVVSDRMLRLVD